jgi:Fe-S-cluster containining protein
MIIPEIMTFVCQMCGECCSSMGEIIAIREETGQGSFRIWFMTTGEERLVTLDSDKQDLFYKTPQRSRMACPFLREVIPGKILCTVHYSRPDLCRQYGCFRILILDAEGNRIGRVMDGTRYFTTVDPVLHEYWQRTCANLDIADENCWEETVAGILTREGYQVVK